MGYSVEEFSSAELTSLYPAHFESVQFINWTMEDIVITKSDGTQTTLLKENGAVSQSTACVVIESLSHNGLRINPNSTLGCRESECVKMKGRRINIPFPEFSHAPIRVTEYNVIISTVEQSMIAKNMACEVNYGSMLYENRTDLTLTDPRFVFQVIDPNNQFDALLVNVFGQTVVLRAGQFGHLIPPTIVRPSFEKPKLICYLKYPTEYFGGAKPTHTVFELDLDSIYKKEPFQLPSGDFVCVATDMESLREVLAKREACTRGFGSGIQVSDKMIPKDVYDTAEANWKAEIARIKEEAKQKLDAEVALRLTTVAKMQLENTQLRSKLESAESRANQWKSLSEASTEFAQNKAKAEQAADKTKKDHEEAVLSAIKVCGTAVSAILSFAASALLKSKK